MVMDGLHEVTFRWPHTEPTTVIVTGTFDQWSSSIHLTKGQTGFEGVAKLPWKEKVAYKFIVDGQWIVLEGQPTETDPAGNLNNVFVTPSKPPALTDPTPTLSPAPQAIEPTSKSAEPANGAADLAAPVKAPEQVSSDVVSPSEPEQSTSKQYPSATAKDSHIRVIGKLKPEATAGGRLPQLLVDIADTIAAREGTSTTFGYVASGLGAAIQSVVGVDPINSDKIAVETPKSDVEFAKPENVVEQQVTESIPEPKQAFVAHDGPISIPPANAPESGAGGVTTPEAKPTNELVGAASAPALDSTPAEADSSVIVGTAKPDEPLAPTDVAVSIPQPTATATVGPASNADNGPSPVTQESILAKERDVSKPVATIAAPVAVISGASGNEPKTEAPASTNGTVAASAVAPKNEPRPSTPTSTPTAPSTPVKNTHHSFPSTESPGGSITNSSPASSRFGTASSRKKRTSILGKFKSIFGHEKEKK